MFNSKHKFIKHVSKQYNCEHYFISIPVVVS